MTRERARERILELETAMRRQFIGRVETLRRVLGAFFSGGHVLVEDVPGVGKTTLAKTLASAMDVEFRRIQFTPDLLPSDVVGVNIYDLSTGTFHFKKGPVFTNILMADEINRSSPKTQSSLLEAMEERQVTMDGLLYPLDSPFMVIATQNPIEFEGTFPLPEAQLDRFMVRVKIGYPGEADEIDILKKETLIHDLSVDHPLGREEIQAIGDAVRTTEISEAIYSYVQRILDATRHHADLHYGLSPRAGIGMIRMARFEALMNGRDFVTPDDLRVVAHDCMIHRMVVKPEAAFRGIEAEGVIGQIMNTVPVTRRV